MNELYNMIFKRKSVRKYDAKNKLSDEDITRLKSYMDSAVHLDEGIKTAYTIVKREETTAKFGEYCMLFYSEDKPFSLLNAGYILEQADLYLASQNIGACWYGMAKTDMTSLNGLDYVIMLAFGKCSPEIFRSGGEQFTRKSMEDISEGNFDDGVRSAVRLAPSACNSQPWRVKYSADKIEVYRETNLRTIIPHSKRTFFGSIDMGICLYFLELSIEQKGIKFERALHDVPAEGSLVHIASYSILR